MTERERRQGPRQDLALKVEYPGREDYLADWTANVSSRGFFIRTDEPYGIGDEVEAKISFPGVIDPVAVIGKVMWREAGAAADGGGVGLRVESGTEQQKLLQLAYLALDAPSGTFRVLVVEDEVLTVEMYKAAVKTLTDEGSKIALDVAFDGQAGLESALANPPDLVITDLYMPRLDGFGLIKKLRANPVTKNTLILAVTAGDWEQAALPAQKAGATDIIRKPFRLDEFLRTMLFLLASKPRE